MYSGFSCFQVREQIAKFWTTKSRVNTACVQAMNRARLWLKNTWPTYKIWCVQRNGMSPEHRVVDIYIQERHWRACNHDWVVVITNLYYSDRVLHVKQIVGLLHSKNLGLNGIWKTLKKVSAWILFVRGRKNNSLKYNRFYKTAFACWKQKLYQHYQFYTEETWRYQKI